MALSRLSTTKRSKLVINLLPEVAELPHTLNTDHKVYWNDFVGEPFQAHLGPRGKKSSNARTWTHDQFVGPFCDELYPKLSPEARKQYETILGPKVYSYLTNHSARGSTGIKAKAQTVKQRVYGHDVWRQEHPEIVEQALTDYKKDNPDAVINIGLRRSLTIDAFRKLPDAEQNKFREKAVDRLKSLQALQIVKKEDQAEYVKAVTNQLRTLIKEAELGANIKINSQLLYEDEDGDFHIMTLVTDCMVELVDSVEVDNLVACMREWVKETASKGLLSDGTPAPTVYPDYERDMYPTVPPIIGLRVIEMQKVLRLEFTLLWGWQGGCGRFPWELICANLDEFIPAERRPANAILGDPSTLRVSIVTTWLEYFHMCQDGTIPPKFRIQFSKLFAGLNPIDPSLSQESSRRLEFIPQQNRETWVLFFTETVDRSHAPGGLEYPPESIAYAKHRINAAHQATMNAFPTTPQEFLDLPIGGAHPKAVIDGQEKALILQWAEDLPENYRCFVIELINAVNELQSHLPATTPTGVWVGQYLNSMPTLLPSSPEALVDGLQFFINFWLPPGYLSPSAEADLTSRFRYFQLYIEDILASLLIRQSPSNTLIGGYNGVVWLARALILLVFNFTAANGDLTPPSDPPSGCDITCLPLDELPNILCYCQDLIEAVRASIAILSKTSGSRMAYNLDSAPTQSQDPVAVPGKSLSPTVVPPQSTSSSSPKLNTSKLKPGTSNDSSVEQNYDDLDQDSDDSDSLNPDGFSGGIGDEAIGVVSKQNNDSTRPDMQHSEGRPRFPAPLPRFTDECKTILLSSISGRTQGHVFGPFPSLPPPLQDLSLEAYDCLYTTLDVAVTKVETTLCDWSELAKVNTLGLNREANAVQRAARELPTPLQPLAYFILARTYAWGRAGVTASHVIDFVPRLVRDARAALQVDIAIANFMEAEERTATISETEYDALSKLHRNLLKGAIELTWIYKEILAFEHLSSDWSKRMPSNWLVEGDDGLPTNRPKLYDLARPLVDWSDAASELDSALRAQRRVMWRPTGRPFEARHNAPLWYRFGNPEPDEKPEGFDACMKAIERLLQEADASVPDVPPRSSETSNGGDKSSAIPEKSPGATTSKSKSQHPPIPKSNNAPVSARITRSTALATALESHGKVLRPRRAGKNDDTVKSATKKQRK